jgi:hypothetical protein
MLDTIGSARKVCLRKALPRYALATLLLLLAAGLEATALGQANASEGLPEASIHEGQIRARPAQSFRGWGMSLALEANDLYGGGRQPAQIKDPKLHIRICFTEIPRPALPFGFNVARYNIAGGDDPTDTHMRPDAQMEGYQLGPGAAFDWTRDAAQRRMLQEAKKRGRISLKRSPTHRPIG